MIYYSQKSCVTNKKKEKQFAVSTVFFEDEDPALLGEALADVIESDEKLQQDSEDINKRKKVIIRHNRKRRRQQTRKN